MHSLVPLVKHYDFTMEDHDNKSKITCQRCNFLYHILVGAENFSILPFSILGCLLLGYTLKSLFHKITTFSGLPELKFNAYIIGFKIS